MIILKMYLMVRQPISLWSIIAPKARFFKNKRQAGTSIVPVNNKVTVILGSGKEDNPV